LSLKKFLDALSGLGFRRSDAKIYAYLAKKGPLKAREICAELGLIKQQVYPCLKNLKKRGVIHASLERPALFYAKPFESVLTMLANQKIIEAQEAGKYKVDTQAIWQKTGMADAKSSGLSLRSVGSEILGGEKPE
jgi:sugar-specific transcriptional regulator TrmB